MCKSEIIPKERLFSKAEIEMFFLNSKTKYLVTPEEVITYWDNKNWTTNKLTPVKSISSAVNVCNGIKANGYRKCLCEKKVPEMIDPVRKGIVPERVRPGFELYTEQLQAKEWKYFREFILSVRGKRCEMCGKKRNLNIHHIHYIAGRKAWEYTCQDVMVVCNECHKHIHPQIRNL